MTNSIVYTTMPDTPVGSILLAADDTGLRFLLFDSGSGDDSKSSDVRRNAVVRPLPEWERNDGRFRDAVQQLNAYFQGRLTQFSLPVAPQGTEFQRRVWTALCDVPYGQTATYGEIAAAIGQPTASRAVGMANGRNPLSIIVPCHRIIGAGGKLVGYGGGLQRKSTLLRLEKAEV
jgi:methylated-DNA-[protein]-cysteine S-methyltransferase